MPTGYSANDLVLLLPEIVLTTGLLVVLVADLFTGRSRQHWLGWLTIGVLVATAVPIVALSGHATTAARGLLAVDGFGTFFKLLFVVAAAITVLISRQYLEVEQARPGEYYFLVLCATLGMMVMAAGIDLITLFIGLETMAVSFYVLTGFLRPNRRSNEAAIKYFVLGAFSLGILLYGILLWLALSGQQKRTPGLAYSLCTWTLVLAA